MNVEQMKLMHQLFLVSSVFVLLATSIDISRGPAAFCELPDPGVFNQKFNAWSSIAFVASGIFTSYKSKQVAVFELLYPMIVVNMGIGSMAYHGYDSRWGGFMDYISILMYMAFVLVISLTFRCDNKKIIAVVQIGAWVVLSVVLSVAAYLTDPMVDGWPTVERTTPIVFGICIGTYAIVNTIHMVLLYRQKCLVAPQVGVPGKKGVKKEISLGWKLFYLVSAAVLLLVSFILWILSQNNESPLCPIFPGFHGIWHIGCAGMTVFLFFYHVEEL